MKKSKVFHLPSQRGEEVGDTPWQVYPRPQLVRDSFLCLNGQWDFAEADDTPTEYTEKIMVPYPPQSLLSGINRVFEGKKDLFYRRSFTLPEGFVKSRVLLHIGACDQICKVFINGQPVCQNIGGYHSFTADITSALKQGENQLVCRVSDDPKSTTLPYGKQKENRGGMWYTPVAGIWQSVWLESVPESYVESIKITTRENRVHMEFIGISEGNITLETPDGNVMEKITNSVADFPVQNPRMWSPEDPYLYHFKVVSGEDSVKSYFALRDLSVARVNGLPRLMLNGKPYFFHGLLDQGYFSDGIYTPATPDCYADDITAMKKMGFNMLRKHIKIEPEQFYYDCDRLGMIVFQDMVNNGHYSFLRDTALPTVGMKKLCDKFMHRSKTSRHAFTEGMKATVKQLYNHPCICEWTIFNEGWGQFCSGEMYCLLKELDNTRFIDSASGWFQGAQSDFTSPHIYFKPIKIKPSDKPVFLSEFGGYSCNIKGHIFNTEKEYGYRHFDTPEGFSAALEELYLKQVIPAVKQGLCGTVYTQVSDVEDETNGLLTYDRKVQKIPTAKMRIVSDKLFTEHKNCTK